MGVLEQAQEMLNSDTKSIAKLKSKAESLRKLIDIISDRKDRHQYSCSLSIKARTSTGEDDIEATVGVLNQMDLDFISGTLRRELSMIEAMTTEIEKKYERLIGDNT